MQAFLEIVILKCPNCKNFIAEPAWFADLEQDLGCARCKKFFPSKKYIKDRKMLKFFIEKDRIKEINY